MIPGSAGKRGVRAAAEGPLLAGAATGSGTVLPGLPGSALDGAADLSQRGDEAAGAVCPAVTPRYAPLGSAVSSLDPCPAQVLAEQALGRRESPQQRASASGRGKPSD